MNKRRKFKLIKSEEKLEFLIFWIENYSQPELHQTWFVHQWDRMTSSKILEWMKKMWN